MSWNVSGVMTRDVVTVELNASFKTCVRLMRMHGVGALPVIADGKLAGIVTVTDLMLKEFRPTVRERYEKPLGGDAELTARTLMTGRLVTITPDAPLVAAVRLMFEHRVSRLPVVDELGRLVGIISRSDILRVFLRSDVSIRNEIAHGLLSGLPRGGRGRIDPAVRNGIVTLEGEVEPGTIGDVLVRLVASVPGVVGVRNRLRVMRPARLHHA